MIQKGFFVPYDPEMRVFVPYDVIEGQLEEASTTTAKQPELSKDVAETPAPDQPK